MSEEKKTSAAKPVPPVQRQSQPATKTPVIAQDEAIKEIRGLQADLKKAAAQLDKATSQLKSLTGRTIKLVALRDIEGPVSKQVGSTVGTLDVVPEITADWLVEQIAAGAIGLN